jgi:hypothetical protein
LKVLGLDGKYYPAKHRPERPAPIVPVGGSVVQGGVRYHNPGQPEPSGLQGRPAVALLGRDTPKPVERPSEEMTRPA